MPRTGPTALDSPKLSQGDGSLLAGTKQEKSWL